MRLNQEEIDAIKQSVLTFDNSAKIWLYGSRVDDSKKGGDIDLLIISQKIGISEKLKIKVQLYKRIGEQKIDIIIVKNKEKPFIRIALDNAVLL